MPGATRGAYTFYGGFTGEGSHGRDGERVSNSLSGFEGSILRQAQYEGYPIGVVNNAPVTELGTGALLAEVDDRDDSEGIALEMLNGRASNAEGEESPDPDPQLMLGGERWFLPEGEDGYHGPGLRTDGRDLIEEAEAMTMPKRAGWRWRATGQPLPLPCWRDSGSWRGPRSLWAPSSR